MRAEGSQSTLSPGRLTGKKVALRASYEQKSIYGSLVGGYLAKEYGFPPVFLSSADIKLEVSRAAKRGQIRKIAPRLYTTNLTEDPAVIIRHNLWEVVGLLLPGTVVGYRTALEGKPSPEGAVNLTGPYDRVIHLPGLVVRQIKGPGPLEGDTQFMQGLWLASRARAFLESMRPSRSRTAGARGLPRREIERRLEQLVRVSGAEEVNRLRDQARSVAPELDAEDEFDKLDGIIGALLGSRTEKLTAPAAKSRAVGIPYDPDRLERFQALHSALLEAPETPRPAPFGSASAFANAAFVDAYFSNYIEGTTFEVKEALEIVFEGKIPAARPADAHDVLGTFQLVSSREEMGLSMADTRLAADDFLHTLRRRHAIIMSARPDQNPGEFKTQLNYAGNTTFVAPELVIGTLRKGFELFRSLPGPIGRAAFMMFLVSEVHPFGDGNGRIGRVMMNAELIAAGQHRIIIPTVYRDDYLLALRALTRQGRTDAFAHMLDRAHEFVSRIDFNDMETTLAMLTAANAFEDPSEARLIMPPG